MSNKASPAGTAHAATKVESNPVPNRIDAFTEFINEWIDTNVKVFSRKENNHDSEVL